MMVRPETMFGVPVRAKESACYRQEKVTDYLGELAAWWVGFAAAALRTAERGPGRLAMRKRAAPRKFKPARIQKANV